MTEVGYATLIGDLGFPGLFQPIKIQILCSKTILVILTLTNVTVLARHTYTVLFKGKNFGVGITVLWQHLVKIYDF